MRYLLWYILFPFGLSISSNKVDRNKENTLWRWHLASFPSADCNTTEEVVDGCASEEMIDCSVDGEVVMGFATQSDKLRLFDVDLVLVVLLCDHCRHWCLC